MLKLRELYCPSHFGNSYECAFPREMEEILREAKHWGYTTYSDWFDPADLVDPESTKSYFNLSSAIWERRFSHFETAARIGFDLGLVITPNHVFIDQLSLARQGTPGDRVFGQLLCPSDPRGRSLIIGNQRSIFRGFSERGLQIHQISMCPYDFGGCLCEQCQPWITTFLDLTSEIMDVAREYFPDARLNLIGWWWNPTEHRSLIEWDGSSRRHAPIQAMAFHLPYDESQYHITDKPIPQSCKEAAFVHIGYPERGTDPSVPRDIYGHFGPVAAPHRIERTVDFLRSRNALGCTAYSEGVFDDVNKAILGALAAGLASSSNAALEAYASRYLGAKTETDRREWCDWLCAWGEPFSVDLREARRILDSLSKGIGDSIRTSWRYRQWEAKLRMFESYAKVPLAGTWDTERTALATSFMSEKEDLWRNIWKLGLPRHIWRHDFCCIPWQKDFFTRRSGRNDVQTNLGAQA